jgi:hypothetical protein
MGKRTSSLYRSQECILPPADQTRFSGNRALVDCFLRQTDLVENLKRPGLDADSFGMRGHTLVLLNNKKINAVSDELAG